ncbi:ABC transporter ATP-binding protein [Actinomadura barringtoniae]|uniref:ABC transporter ATP-binding protein n=1 Tax=Actinomadura barringtoniae TaxID=1427535 RepID=A0A939TB76_9ACTN|nr:ABC transporter ATP-binding protein [Actinomadura barringtoniae]MBO2449860.1 ABC transporter ATP-binding protein [Actinomadura barringtoniae]
MNLLDVRDLRVSFPTADGIVQAVRGVSFTVEPGRTLGIVGESGSGKSVSVQTLMGLTAGADVDGEALFDGQDLLTMGEREMRRVRGAQIAMIFQDPLSSLHPHYRVGWQIIEMIREHEPQMSKAEARKRAIEMLGLVGIPQPDRRVDDYPHQFSGGMRQRAMIAMGLSLHPKLIIADEPTTALDATVQAQILDLMRRLQREFDTALIMITHDLGVIADMADDVLVMYGGKAAEESDRRTLYYRPHHPYTKGLLESVPGASGAKGTRLKPIPGQPPSLINLPGGCVFHPRCEYVMARCRTEAPPLHAVATDESGTDGTHLSACWLPRDAIGLTPAAEEMRLAAVTEGGGPKANGAATPAPKTDVTKTDASASDAPDASAPKTDVSKAPAQAEPNEEGTE